VSDSPAAVAARVRALAGAGFDPGLATSAGPDLAVVPCRQGAGLVVHLLNYAYDTTTRAFAPQENVTVTLTVPAELDLAGRSLRLLSPDSGPEGGLVLAYDLSAGKLVFTVPRVDVYAVVVTE